MQQSQPTLFKFIILGDQSVGKSSIINQYLTSEFQTQYNITIGVEFAKKEVQIDKHTSITLQIWDTAGQEIFKSMIRSFYRNAAAVLLVYSVTSKDSLHKLKDWLREVRENAHEDIIVVLVGNKSDMDSSRTLTYQDGVAFMKQNTINIFFETSAKSGANIDQAFTEAAKMVLLRFIGSENFRNSVKSSKSTPKMSEISRTHSKALSPRHKKDFSNGIPIIQEEEEKEHEIVRQSEQMRSIKLSTVETPKLQEKQKKCSC